MSLTLSFIAKLLSALINLNILLRAKSFLRSVNPEIIQLLADHENAALKIFANKRFVAS